MTNIEVTFQASMPRELVERLAKAEAVDLTVATHRFVARAYSLALQAETAPTSTRSTTAGRIAKARRKAKTKKS